MKDVLLTKWSASAERTDCVEGLMSDGTTPYFVVVTETALIPQILALQNAAHKGYTSQQKLLASNEKLLKELAAAKKKAEDLQAKLDLAEERALAAASESIASLFTY